MQTPTGVHQQLSRAAVLAVLLALLATSCVSPISASPAGPTPKAVTAASSPRQEGLGPSSSAATRQAAESAALKCRLPITRQGSVDPAAVRGSGFITFPAGTYADDEASAVVPPALGYQAKMYDWAVRRWLPVARSSVSPDGMHYVYVVYAEPVSGLHVVDVATGIDRVVGPARRWLVLDYGSEGVYAMGDDPAIAGFFGLWLINPTTGEVSNVHAAGLWGLVQSGVVVGYQPATDYRHLVRFDLRTGREEVWYGPGLVPLAVDRAGRLIGATAADATRSDSVKVLAEPLKVAASYPVSELQPITLPFSTPSALVDGDRVWIGGRQAMYLLTSQGLLKVADVGGFPVGGCH